MPWKMIYMCFKLQQAPDAESSAALHDEAAVIKEQCASAEEEAWLVDWFAKYKHDHSTYLIPIRELDLPIRIREYRKHFHQVSQRVKFGNHLIGMAR